MDWKQQRDCLNLSQCVAMQVLLGNSRENVSTSLSMSTHQVLVDGLLDGAGVLALHLGGLERVLDVQRRGVVAAPLPPVMLPVRRRPAHPRRVLAAAGPVARAALRVQDAAVGALQGKSMLIWMLI